MVLAFLAALVFLVVLVFLATLPAVLPVLDLAGELFLVDEDVRAFAVDFGARDLRVESFAALGGFALFWVAFLEFCLATLFSHRRCSISIYLGRQGRANKATPGNR